MMIDRECSRFDSERVVVEKLDRFIIILPDTAIVTLSLAKLDREISSVDFT